MEWFKNRHVLLKDKYDRYTRHFAEKTHTGLVVRVDSFPVARYYLLQVDGSILGDGDYFVWLPLSGFTKKELDTLYLGG